MIEWETAHQLAAAHAGAILLAVDGDRAVLDDRGSVAYDFGWLFQYQSSWFLQTGDARWQLLDNHPFVVDRRDGRIISVPVLRRDETLARFQQAWVQGLPLT